MERVVNIEGTAPESLIVLNLKANPSAAVKKNKINISSASMESKR